MGCPGMARVAVPQGGDCVCSSLRKGFGVGVLGANTELLADCTVIV